MLASAPSAPLCATSPWAGPGAPRQLGVRLLTPDDVPLAITAFARLSLKSRHLRYGLPVRDAERALEWMHLLGDARQVALGACAESGEPVGLARYVRRGDGAEVAVTILDAWQGRGAGTLLLDSLCAHARAAGIAALRASVLAENRPALRLATRFGARRLGWDGGMLEYELSLENPQMAARAPLPRLDALDDHEAPA